MAKSLPEGRLRYSSLDMILPTAKLQPPEVQEMASVSPNPL
jgi:hypothetical protein